MRVSLFLLGALLLPALFAHGIEIENARLSGAGPETGLAAAAPALPPQACRLESSRT